MIPVKVSDTDNIVASNLAKRRYVMSTTHTL